MKTRTFQNIITKYSLSIEAPRGQSFSAHAKSNNCALEIFNLISEHHFDIFGCLLFKHRKGDKSEKITIEEAMEIARSTLANMEIQSIPGARDFLTMFKAKKILRNKVADLVAYSANYASGVQ